jgi:hypothetical protein
MDGVLQVRPFTVTLIPASRRSEVAHETIELIAKLDVSKWLETETMNAGYDPFSGSGDSTETCLDTLMDDEKVSSTELDLWSTSISWRRSFPTTTRS